MPSEIELDGQPFPVTLIAETLARADGQNLDGLTALSLDAMYGDMARAVVELLDDLARTTPPPVAVSPPAAMAWARDLEAWRLAAMRNRPTFIPTPLLDEALYDLTIESDLVATGNQAHREAEEEIARYQAEERHPQWGYAPPPQPRPIQPTVITARDVVGSWSIDYSLVREGWELITDEVAVTVDEARPTYTDEQLRAAWRAFNEHEYPNSHAAIRAALEAADYLGGQL